MVVLGIDGLDRGLLEARIEQGHLPTFARLMSEGVVADVRVGQPILSPRIWTTLASGYPAEVHGVLDWVHQDGRPFRADDVAVQRVWDAVSEAGKTVLVSGWLMTTPVSQVQGVMLSDELVLRGSLDAGDAMAPGRDPRVVEGWLAWPEPRLSQAEEWIPSSRWLAAHPLAYQVSASSAVTHPLRRDETHARSLEVLVPELQPDLTMVYLSGADQLSHQLWPFVDPQGIAAMTADPQARARSAAALAQMHSGKRELPFSEGATGPAELEAGARWVHDYYDYLDTVLARTVDRVEGSGATLIVVSDHGFRVTDRPVPLFADHDDPAVLIAWGARVRSPGAEVPVHMHDLAPTLYALLGVPAAEDMPGRPLSGIFELSPQPAVPTRRREAPEASPGPGNTQQQRQLEALGYTDGEGRPIPQPPR